MKETAWESPLLVKAIWGKQGCILCLLINTNLPWTARKQNFAGENDQKELEEEMKENSSCQALPLIPTMPRMTNTIATRNISFYFSSSNPPAGVRRTDRSPCWSWTLLPARGPRKLQRSGRLCMNPSESAGLEFRFFPTLLPLSGHKPVLLDKTIRSSDHKAVLAMLFFSPLFHSSNFYRVRYLWWAGWYFLQKLDELILNFCMFLHRKTPTIIYRQLCQNGNYGFRPTHLLACDPLNVGSLQMPFKDMWLSPTLWCLQGRLQLPPSAKGSTVRLLHRNQHRQGLPQPVRKLSSCIREVLDARKGHPRKMFYTRIPTSVVIVNYGMSLCENDTTENILTPQRACICGATLKLLILF